MQLLHKVFLVVLFAVFAFIPAFLIFRD